MPYVLMLSCIYMYCIGEWSFKEAGFTAIGSPESIETGTTHGVYVLDDMDALRSKYEKGTYVCTLILFL